MKKLWLLTKIQLLSLLKVNQLKHGGAGNDNTQTILMGALYLFLGGFSGYICYTMADALAAAGLASSVPALMVAVSSLVVLIFTFLKSNGVLFGYKDYDMVMSLPVSSHIVIGSRLLAIYLLDLVFTCVAIVPAYAVYLQYTGIDAVKLLFLLLTILICPVLPIIVAMILSAVITAIASRYRFANAITLVLTLAGTIAIIIGSMFLQYAEAIDIEELGEAMSQMIASYYPPAYYIQQAYYNSNILSFLVFILITIIPTVIFILILAKYYKRINSLVAARRTKSNFRLGEVSASNPFEALYKKELKRLVTCPTYFMNTGIGGIIILCAAVALIFYDPFQMEIFVAIKEQMPVIPMLSVAISFCCLLSSMTAVSYSLEGKNRWLPFSLPVRPKTIFDAKMALNLTLLIPPCILICTILSFRLMPSFIDAVILYLFPIVSAFFITVIGMALNIKYPSFDWTSEHLVVKRSLPLMLLILIGMVAAMIPFVLSLVLSDWIVWIMILYTVILALITIYAYIKISRIHVLYI